MMAPFPVKKKPKHNNDPALKKCAAYLKLLSPSDWGLGVPHSTWKSVILIGMIILASICLSSTILITGLGESLALFSGVLQCEFMN